VGIFQRLFGKKADGDDSGREGEQRGMSKEEALAAYVLREHKLGRSLDEILEDPYPKNRASEEQRLRLLERPEVIRAVGEDTAAMARDRARS
jgi:hypothetical protein